MKKIILLALLLIFSALSTPFTDNHAEAQTVSTLITNINADALVVDAAGNVYASDYLGTSTNPAAPNGKVVRKITPQGVVSICDSSSFGPTGLALDAAGNLYIASFVQGNLSAGKIIKRTPAGDTTTFASGLLDLGALTFDNAGNLYAASYGGNRIYKITSGGAVSTLASGSPLNGTVGMAWGNDTLYASNFTDGKIFKVSATGAVTQIADVLSADTQYPVNYLMFLNNALYINVGSYFASQTAGNRIFKVSLTGQVSTFAGTGVAGQTNGAVATATFNGNNGLAQSPTGDTLYVSDANAKSLRRIIGVKTMSVSPTNSASKPEGFLLEQNYPNPFNPSTSIAYALGAATDVSLKVFDVLGREVASLVNGRQAAGKYRVNFEASGLTSGTYFYRLSVSGSASSQSGSAAAGLQAGSFSETKKMFLVK